MADNDIQIDYAKVLADLTARRDALNAAIAAIEPIVNGTVSQPIASSRKSAKAETAEIQSDTFFNMTVPDATRKYLSMMRKPQSTPQIAEALERGGFTHQSEKFGNTVGAVLHRIAASSGGDIIKVSRGNWGLASWYGPKRSGSEPKGRDEPDTGNGG